MQSDNPLPAITRVFVYGTLKPGGQYHEEYCGTQLVEAVAAIAPGQLYDFPHLGYPAMTHRTADSGGQDWVQGFLLIFKNEAILHRLDELEDYDPQGDPTQNEYDRQRIAVFTPAKQPLGEAWIYLMAPERAAEMGGMPLPDGHWPLPDGR